MEKYRRESLYDFYKGHLLEDCLPFWLRHGLDQEYGGIMTCLDRQGEVYCTDKSVWFQGRAAWLFARLYRVVEHRAEWLEAARSCYDFLVRHCFDQDGRMFFAVTREGRPLRKRRYVFSETFAVIACAEYSRAAGDGDALARARDIYDLLLDLYRHPEKLPPKIDPRTRPAKSLALPMILLATTQSLREADPDPRYEENAREFIEAVLGDFYQPDEGILRETVGPRGERLDGPAGRCFNPGHAIETAWFLMHEGMHRQDGGLVDTALRILDRSLEIGWDEEYGGLFSFVDLEGKPLEQLEWDMKLWWPQTEAMYATLLAYRLTGDARYERWHATVHDWAFTRFPDREYGEWFGYLHRDGTVANTLKGSLWKGPFHLPRALLFMTSLLWEMASAQPVRPAWYETAREG